VLPGAFLGNELIGNSARKWSQFEILDLNFNISVLQSLTWLFATCFSQLTPRDNGTQPPFEPLMGAGAATNGVPGWSIS
jgi:hypothetical protein